MPASIAITERTHIMGPKGEIIATLYPYNDGKGISLDFEFENVEVKVNGHDLDGDIDSLTVSLLE